MSIFQRIANIFKTNPSISSKTIDLPKEIIGKDDVPMVLIPAGEFRMGSNSFGSEEPVHTVYLDAFYMDVYEVTNAQYKNFIEANPQWRKDKIDSQYHDGGYLSNWDGNNFPEDKANHPVVYVSWYAVKTYAEWVGERLPTEAEWEKAARGGLVKGMEYPWGDNITHNDANYQGTGGKDIWDGTAPVGSFAPNRYGLYDMVGNVWEWCIDWYDEEGYPKKSHRHNPIGPDLGEWRVCRGGAWNRPSDYLRVAYRGANAPNSTHPVIGFRCGVSRSD
jgi:formylglycine-generating enzyme required for sulfatase activity